jgi:hypothetical protein
MEKPAIIATLRANAQATDRITGNLMRMIASEIVSRPVLYHAVHNGRNAKLLARASTGAQALSCNVAV